MDLGLVALYESFFKLVCCLKQDANTVESYRESAEAEESSETCKDVARELYNWTHPHPQLLRRLS